MFRDLSVLSRYSAIAKSLVVTVLLVTQLLISQGVAASRDDYDSLDAGAFDIYQGAIPIQEYSFEVDEDLDYDRQPDDWEPRQNLVEVPKTCCLIA